MSDDDEDTELADEFLAHALMKETQRYLSRGRVLLTLTDVELVEAWVASFERWFDNREDIAFQTEMDDAAAELRLRDIPAPYDRVTAKTDLLVAEIERQNLIDNSEELNQQIGEFLAARERPKN